MHILGIETSCDETSAAVVEDGRSVRSCAISSSKDDFRSLGGVIPEDAARKQLESILPVIDLALTKARITLNDIGALAVTYCPGLLGSLLVGTSTARVLSALHGKPLIPVHHTLGHLSSTWLKEVERGPHFAPEGASRGKKGKVESVPPQFPILTLSVSGGHSDLWYRTKHTEGLLIGSTKDDAAGEAFDKGARLLGLPYPGGPMLAKRAESGDEHAFPFPLPLRNDGTLDFSFSGLKTSLKYLLRDLADRANDPQVQANIAASFQRAICLHLLDRLASALDRYPDTKEVHIVGGVSANTKLRALARELVERTSVTLRVPKSLQYCTDNAAMIASAGYFLLHERSEGAVCSFRTSATSDLSDLLHVA